MPRPQNKILVDQINKRMDDIKNRDSVIGMHNMTIMQLQQNACRELYCEMIAEDLLTTASEILKYVELQPNQKIVETSDSFRIIATGGVVINKQQSLIAESEQLKRGDQCPSCGNTVENVRRGATVCLKCCY